MVKTRSLARINILLSKINKKLWRQRVQMPFEKKILFHGPDLGSVMNGGSLND